MRIVILAYAALMLISLIATIYTMWAYHHCPDNRSHRPLVFPMVCSMAWFLVSVDQLMAIQGKYHGSIDGLSLVMLISVTLIALLYFVKAYIVYRQQPCTLKHYPDEA